jgi:hypothetical protein
MKLIPLLLLTGMLAVSGCSKREYKPEPYSPELVKKAEAGDADAQNNLGGCYLYGKGVAVDFSQAYMWFTKSAEQGNASGQNGLGCCYHTGEGVAQDHKEAVKWYRKSAEQGDAEAQHNLGGCYNYGQGVDQDHKEAVKWYTKSAEKGDATAQYQLGVCYYNGTGLDKDYKEAVKLYTKSAVQGDAKAQFLNALKDVTDPEEKRKIIGREFIRSFEAAARDIAAGGDVEFLVQGTLYPDVVESGGGTGTANIKSHHNVGGLPDDLQFTLIEPLRTLFKDEVRQVGLELGLPEEIIWRQPFPGPGLGIRIIGSVTQ